MTNATAIDKVEKILEVPACYISREVANLLAVRIHAIAEEQSVADYVQVLSQMAPRLNMTPEEAIRTYGGNAELRRGCEPKSRWSHCVWYLPQAPKFEPTG